MPNPGGIQLLPETRKKIEVKMPGENRLLTIGTILLVLVMVLFVGLKSLTHGYEQQVREKNAAIVDIVVSDALNINIFVK